MNSAAGLLASGEQGRELVLRRGWELEEERGLVRLADEDNRVGELAEAVGHHPDITLAWGLCGIRIWTHKIDGLTESDFVLAAKIDGLVGG